MSDHTDTTLTDTELTTLDGGIREWEDHGGPLLNALKPVVESIVAARVAAARADERARLVTWVESAQSLSVATAEDYRGCCRSCDESYAPGIRHGGRVVADRLRALMIEGADQ